MIEDIKLPKAIEDAYKDAICGVKVINEALDRLRNNHVACSLRENEGRYYLDAKLMLSMLRTK